MLAEVAFSISDIVVGLLATGAVVWQARKTRRETKQELDTGNAHTAGQALARLEDMAWRHEQRLDGVDVQLSEGRETFDEIDVKLDRIETTLDSHVDEATARFDATEQKLEQHIYETRPLRNWVVEQIEKEGTDG